MIKKKKPFTETGDKPKGERPEPMPPPPMLRRIHVLRSIATGQGVYQVGATLVIGVDINEKVARQWITVGMAEEDTALAGAPETK